MAIVEERVDRLEQALVDFTKNVGIEFNKVYNLQARAEIEFIEFKKEMKDFKDEMKDFKDEMKDFKDEMKDFKDEMKDFKNGMEDFKNGMEDFKNGMEDFKDEMKDFKGEARLQNRDMNQKWGDMANKMGTIVEDLVAPSIPRIIKEEFNLETEFFGIRMRKKLKNGNEKEYDAIAATGNYVYLNSTKSTLKKLDSDDFIKDIKEFRKFFPEYQKNKIIGILASLHVDKGVIKYAEKKGLMVLSVGDQLMEVKNTSGFKPKEW